MGRLQKIIDMIREKPEHIRVRYVIGCVAIGMVIVVLIWTVSLSMTFDSFQKSVNTEKSLEELKKAENAFGGYMEVLQGEKEVLSEQSNVEAQEQKEE